jgi:hypothetical protein
MDAGAAEREGPPFHGLVSRVPGAWRAGRRGAPQPVPGIRPLLALLVLGCLVAGVTGGLLRLGVLLPWSGSGWAGQAAVAHAALMIPAFFGTAIGIERAVAVKLRWAFAAPLLSGLAGLCLATGAAVTGAALAVAASVAFVAVHVLVVRRQSASHTWLLLVGAGCLLAGNVLLLLRAAADATLAFWFAFLVITIAAERLEMTRLMRRRRGASVALYAILGLLLAGAAASAAWPVAGGVAYGAALLLLASWLACFDIARRTVRTSGLSRYMAVCLLCGYAWLAAAGVAWAAASMGFPGRDLALHGLGLGFVFSMVFGHAPVILPAVARVKFAFHPAFFVPLAVLHLSLAWRFGPGATDLGQRALAGAWNAGALLLFALTLAVAAWRWRRLHPGPATPGA